MAIYHLSVKTISRSSGRTSTAAAAYRAADKITDERTGEIHDYTRKRGVLHTEIILPYSAPAWSENRAALWNAAEQSETRKNSTVAREFEIALPEELSKKERQRLAVDFAKEIVQRHGVAADVAIHEPSRGGDNRNHHAHILITTRQLTQDGFGKKTRELDDRKTGEVDYWRERFAQLQNERLEQNGVNEMVDHRTLKAQGIEREPSKHLGIEATNYERRTGEKSKKRLDFEAATSAEKAEIVEIDKEIKKIGFEINQIKRESGNALIAVRQSLLDETVELMKARAIKRKAERQKTEQTNVTTAPISEAIQQPPVQKLEPVLMQETTEQREKRAADMLLKLTMQARDQWRETESKKLFDEVKEMLAKHKELSKSEPRWMMGLNEKKWQEWVDSCNDLKKRHDDTRAEANLIKEGNSASEQVVKSQFEQTATKELQKHHPELYQALMDKAARERAQAEEARQQKQQERLARNNRDKGQDFER